MNKKIKIIVLIVILIILALPLIGDIVYKVRVDNFYDVVLKVKLQANINTVKNKDILDYYLYVDVKNNGFNEFNLNQINNGDLEITKDKIVFALYNNHLKKCAFKKTNSEEVILIDMIDSSKCFIQNLKEEDEESNFVFDKKTQTITDYYGSSKVTIPSEINGITVKEIGKQAFMNKSINTVYIPDSIEKINSRAFMNNDIVSVVVKSPKIIIEDQAFMNNLIETLEINEAIYGIDSFKNNLLTDKAYFINENVLVSYGGSITDIKIPDNVQKVTATFDNLTKSFNTGEGLKEIPDDFLSNQQLEEIVIGSNVVTIGSNSFANNNIKELTILSSEVIGDSAFINNTIESIVFPDNLKTINKQAFKGNQLYNITFNSELDYVGKEAFKDNNLISLKLNSKIIEEQAFMNNLIETVEINSSNYGIDSFKNNLLTDKAYFINDNTLASYGGSSKVDIKIPDNVQKVTATFDNLTKTFDTNNIVEMPENMLINNQLTKVIIGSKVVSIGKYAFANNLIEEITIPKSVLNIEDNALYNNPLNVILIKGKAGKSNFNKLGNNWNGNCLNIIYELPVLPS